jgi:hypothetical protein
MRLRRWYLIACCFWLVTSLPFIIFAILFVGPAEVAEGVAQGRLYYLFLPGRWELGFIVERLAYDFFMFYPILLLPFGLTRNSRTITRAD